MKREELDKMNGRERCAYKQKMGVLVVDGGRNY